MPLIKIRTLCLPGVTRWGRSLYIRLSRVLITAWCQNNRVFFFLPKSLLISLNCGNWLVNQICLEIFRGIMVAKFQFLFP